MDQHADPEAPSSSNVQLAYYVEDVEDTDENGTVPGGYHPIIYERDFLTSAKVGTFLCVIAISINLIVFAAFFSAKKLRINFIYIQVASIALADLGFVVMVDTFTIYYEVQTWELGATFCKIWMMLDMALSAVAMYALVCLNVDRVLYTYCTACYLSLIRSRTVRIFVVCAPWLVCLGVVCPIWLGFPAVEPEEKICIYGITEEANTASSWVTVFIPSLAILLLLIFVFIAMIGEMPSTSVQMNGQYGVHRQPTRMSGPNQASSTPSRSRPPVSQYEMTTDRTYVAVPQSDGRRQRRFVAALLAVDFMSLAITLPFSAFSMVSPSCDDVQSCSALHTLFQTLSWMRSSVTFFRPLLFFFLTDLFRSVNQRFRRHLGCGRGSPEDSLSLSSVQGHSQVAGGEARHELVSFAHVSRPRVDGYRSRDESVTNCTMITPPHSPHRTSQSGPLPQSINRKPSVVLQTVLNEQEATSV